MSRNQDLDSGKTRETPASTEMEILEDIMQNRGLLHVKEQIFGYLDRETLEKCCQVSPNWSANLERFSAVKFLLDFGKRETIMDLANSRMIAEFHTVIPGWVKAVRTSQMSLQDLKEIQDSLQDLTKYSKRVKNPVHRAVLGNHMTLMKLFLQTSYDFNQCNIGGLFNPD